MDIPRNLTKEVKARLNSIKGQIGGLIRMLDEDQSPSQIMHQFQAVRKGVEQAYIVMLDEVYRKTLALKIVKAGESCPGNCGQEEKIQHFYQRFPDFQLEELSKLLQEFTEIEKKIPVKDS